MTRTAPSTPTGDVLVAATNVLVLVFIAIMPVNLWYGILIDEHSPFLSGSLLGNTYVMLSDILFVLLIAFTIPRLLRAPRQLAKIPVLGLAMLTVVGLIGVVVRPTPEGIMTILRLVGATALVLCVMGMARDTFERFVVWPFALMATMQSLIALGQTLVFDSGNAGRDDLVTGDTVWTAGLGTFNHEYKLSAFLVLAIAVVLATMAWRRLHPVWWVAVGLSGAAIGTSFGRASALALLIVAAAYGIAWLVTRSGTFGLAAVVPSVAMATITAITRDGWATRASFESDVRVAIAQRALEIIRAHPLGISPGRYGLVLAELGPRETDMFVVHNLPLLVTAEFGLIGGTVFVIWLLLLAYRSLRASVGAFAVFLAAVPFMVFDNLHYVYPSGFALLGIWAGAIGMLATTARDDDTRADAAAAQEAKAV